MTRLGSPGAVSVAALARAIRRLPSDRPSPEPKKWYLTQKEHWLGWLREYAGPGAYGRRAGGRRTAEVVYNRIVEPKMLVWLIKAARVAPALRRSADRSAARAVTMASKSAAIRRHVPWPVVATAIRKRTAV